MAFSNSTPGSGGRATSPTVFEQQREELVREIALVSKTGCGFEVFPDQRPGGGGGGGGGGGRRADRERFRIQSRKLYTPCSRRKIDET